jgi:hypothetical protein
LFVLLESEPVITRLTSRDDQLAVYQSRRAAWTCISVKWTSGACLKCYTPLLMESLSCHWSVGQKHSDRSRGHQELIRRIVDCEAFRVSRGNWRSSSSSSWFLSPTNTQLQGDQRRQQVSCGSRRPTSFPHGVEGQDLPASCEEMNYKTYKCTFSDKSDGITSDVKKRE